jgi:hypothetical protein
MPKFLIIGIFTITIPSLAMEPFLDTILRGCHGGFNLSKAPGLKCHLNNSFEGKSNSDLKENTFNN